MINNRIKNKIKELYKNKSTTLYKNKSIYNLEYMQEFAKERGGKCLSKKYINMTTHLKWECKEDHVWSAIPTCVISRGQWCAKCSSKNAAISKRIDWKDIQDAAIKKNGKLLSDESEYINTYSKLKWQCEYGHIWYACIDSVKNTNRWCPKCNISYGENLSREILQTIFKKQFPSCKPEWLINPITNRPLELDGYNDELKLAFEYNGIQHYKKNIYSKTKEILNNQFYRDNIKKNVCDKLNIKLIIIPYKYDNENDIKKCIVEQLKDFGYNVNSNIKIDKKNLYKTKRIQKFKEKIKKLGYKLMTEYKGYLKPVTLKCINKGHIFDILPSSITKNHTCPVCSGYRVKTTEQIKKICLEHEIKFMEKEYKAGNRFKTKCLNCGLELKIRHADLKNYVCRCKKQNGN